MPDILKIDTEHWELEVWASDIKGSQAKLKKTLEKRSEGKVAKTELRLSPQSRKAKVSIETGFTEHDHLDRLTLPKVLFFESKSYEFTIFLNEKFKIKNPKVLHSLIDVEKRFRYEERSRSLRGSIDFGNNIGWFRFSFSYDICGKEYKQDISFQVFPTKMDMETDYDEISKLVDEEYPLWRFSFAKKTEQGFNRSKERKEHFPLLWIAQFKSLREEFEKGVKTILNSPHSRLVSENKQVRADRLRGRLGHRLEEKVKEGLQAKQYQKRYQVKKKTLSVDTPENRFVKMILYRCVGEIQDFAERSEFYNTYRMKGNGNFEKKEASLSQRFFDELASWKKPLQQFLNRPLFKEVGAAEILKRESLVLHERAGYSKVYRIWQELKMYLDVFGDDASISLKQICDLYEVWCFLEIKKILKGLGFDEKIQEKSILSTGLEVDEQKGFAATFDLVRQEKGGNETRIRLIHEPKISNREAHKKKNEKSFSYTGEQKPDIYIEVCFPNGEKLVWIFDPKYKVDHKRGGKDEVPSDNLNTMHRYRDAIIYAHRKDELHRPVIGAYCLYPGFFDQSKDDNPHEDEIKNIGIGAFALLPSTNGSLWLENFLKEKLGSNKESGNNYPMTSPDHLFLEESSRIYPLGMKTTRHQDLDLCFVAPLGPKRSEGYYEKFKKGKATYYHMPVKTSNDQGITDELMSNLRYCAVAQSGEVIKYVYEIISVKKVNRLELTEEQTGIVKSESDADFWLFELKYLMAIPEGVHLPGRGHFKFKLTSFIQLQKAESWKMIEEYSSI